MQTHLHDDIATSSAGQEAEAILRACVHCGFCTAVCPTYTLLGDERDSPRGRIYLIKNLLEDPTAGEETRQHLDRCLTCRACERACPSGVQYARLADIGRAELERRLPRPWAERLARFALRWLLPHPRRFAAALALGRLVKPLLPDAWRQRIPPPKKAAAWPSPHHTRTMLLPGGCVQPALDPATDAALARLLDQVGISALAVGAGCCGALDQHLSAPETALARMRANIDAWWPHIEAGAEAIVISASGCGSMVREYGHLLRHDARYAEKAARISELCRDPAEILASFDWHDLGHGQRIAFQAPCSLQNGLKLDHLVEAILRNAGFTLTPVDEPGMCCGAAGAYTLLQPEMSSQLLERKMAALQAGRPALIVTANIGCQTQLQSAGSTEVLHWVTLLERAASERRQH